MRVQGEKAAQLKQAAVRHPERGLAGTKTQAIRQVDPGRADHVIAFTTYHARCADKKSGAEGIRTLDI